MADLKVDLKVESVTEGASKNWFTEEMAQSILERIAKTTKEEINYHIQPNSASILQKLINKLNNLYIHEQSTMEKIKNTSTYYTPSKGWYDFIYQKNDLATYEEIFHICSDILDILRTGGLDAPIQLAVYEKTSDGLKVYYGNEKDLTLKKVDSTAELDYDKNDAALKIKELSRENIFAQHFFNFRNAISHRKALEPLYDKLKKTKQINEGHIIEAYQRHLYFQHNITIMDEDVFNNPTLIEDIETRWIAINLYYSVNNDAWFTGGDVGIIQNKGDNVKIASILSVQHVASYLLNLAQHYKNFSVKNFKKLFTQDDLNNMIRKDPERIGNKAIKDIVSMTAEKAKKLSKEES